MLMNLNNLHNVLSKHSSQILTGVSVCGLIATTIMAVKCTPAALDMKAEAECVDTSDEFGEESYEIKDLSPWETIQACWTAYIPVYILGGLTIGCMIGSTFIDTKKNAALMSAYLLSEETLDIFKQKVSEEIGEKKMKDLEKKVVPEVMKKHPIKKSNKIFETGDGDTIVFDRVTGRYFKSSIEKLKRIENEFNAKINQGDWICLNDVYFDIGLDPISIGDDLGWYIHDSGLIDFHFGSCLDEEGNPCVTLNFQVVPKGCEYERLRKLGAI